jgi:hypothetical protein
LIATHLDILEALYNLENATLLNEFILQDCELFRELGNSFGVTVPYDFEIVSRELPDVKKQVDDLFGITNLDCPTVRKLNWSDYSRNLFMGMMSIGSMGAASTSALLTHSGEFDYALGLIGGSAFLGLSLVFGKQTAKKPLNSFYTIQPPTITLGNFDDISLGRLTLAHEYAHHVHNKVGNELSVQVLMEGLARFVERYYAEHVHKSTGDSTLLSYSLAKNLDNLSRTSSWIENGLGFPSTNNPVQINSYDLGYSLFRIGHHKVGDKILQRGLDGQLLW